MVRGVLRRSGIDPAQIESAVMGNVIQAGAKMNPARQAAIDGGLSVHVPALTVNRVCGSGAQAIATAATEILAGYASCEAIVNVEGGAIAHGHAIGTTGAVLTTRLIRSMKRDGLERGIVTLCIGGGQGIALALEML